MTKRELNIKAIDNRIKNEGEKYFQIIEDEIKPELIRLHNIDKELNYFSLESLKTLIILNRLYRAIPMHRFGIYAEIDGIL
jgi:hypothetical protein